MKKIRVIRNILFLLVVGALTTGCTDVQFQDVSVAGKGISSNEEIPDPDNPVVVLPPVDPIPDDPVVVLPPVDPIPDDPVVVLPPVDPEPNPEPVTSQQTFLQTAGGGKLDLLIVVDNSDSMMMDHGDHKVRHMFRNFLKTLEGVDYQIGFTTTDMTTATYFSKFPGWSGRLDVLEGTQQKILRPNTANKEALFGATIDREESIPCRKGSRENGAPCGSNYEEPLKAIKSFVDRRDTDNVGFFRADADFVSVIVADQDETPKAGTPTEAKSVVDHVASVFAGTKKYTNYSVIVEPGDRACLQKQICSGSLFGICLEGAEYGAYATELSRITSGRTTSICSTDVSPDLAVIGQSLRNGGLFQEVTLQHEPVQGSVEVFFSPQSNIQYSVEGRTVKFSSKPAPGTSITVRYQHL
jgi:hypothetical protein